MARSAKQDRLLVRKPFKHFRRTYSLTEVRWGLVVLVVLASLFAWVMWRGANPDPALFASAPLSGSEKKATDGALPDGIPSQLTVTGWAAGKIAEFTKDNLYVKINGRADFFLSYGFKKLTFVPLTGGDEGGPSVDVEIYDLGSAANALGAFSGERGEGVEPDVFEGGMSYRARNALYVARGPYYVRAIGSDESDAVLAELSHLKAELSKKPEGGAAAGLPWAYELLTGSMSVAPSAVSYLPANGFSFEFGRDLYVATVADDSEVFAVVSDDADAAEQLAAKFVGGFESYGNKVAGEPAPGWVKDKYLGQFATARSVGKFVVGVRGAAELDAAKANLAKIAAGVEAMTDEAKAAAVPAPPADSTEEGDVDQGLGEGDKSGEGAASGGDSKVDEPADSAAVIDGEPSYDTEPTEGGSTEE